MNINKKILLSILGIFLILIGYFLINYTSHFKKISTNFLNSEQRQIIKRYIFPYRVISQQEEQIIKQEKEIYQQKEYSTSFIYNIEER